MNNVNSIIYEGVEYSIFGTILEFKSMSNLLLMNKTDILDGMIVYVKDEDNYYIWFTSNDSDPVPVELPALKTLHLSVTGSLSLLVNGEFSMQAILQVQDLISVANIRI